MPDRPEPERLRLCLISGSHPPMACGVGDYTAALAAALAATARVEVTVVTDRRAAGGERPGYRLLPLVGAWGAEGLDELRRLVMRLRPDLVHLQYPTQGYGRAFAPSLLPLLLRASGVQIVQTWHERYRGRSVRALCQALVPGPIVVVRPAYHEQLGLPVRLLVPPRRLHLLPNGPSLPRLELGPGEAASLRAELGAGRRSLVVYFGFIYPPKGVDDLFRIADPGRDHLVLVGRLDPGDAYHRRIRELANAGGWAGHVSCTGFLPAPRAARILAAADAVVLPFRAGGGIWNSSLHGAVRQGAYVVTTGDGTGYDPGNHVHWAKPGDVAGMRAALTARLGQRRTGPPAALPEWPDIALRHLAIYQRLLGRVGPG
jgi:glycosyltransferase involved in cell wall biosynthesis